MAPAAEGDLPLGSVEGWQHYVHGLGFVTALRAGERPRASWSAVPGDDPARLVAEAVLATLGSGRGAVVCVPDVRDVARWDAVFAEVLGPGRHVALTAAQPPAERWRSFLAASRGDVQVVLGTRAAAFAPVADLGLVAIWDDGDDMFAEPRSPYPHAREVLLLRATTQDTAVLIGGYARTAESQSLIEGGWCVELVADQRIRRQAWPQLLSHRRLHRRGGAGAVAAGGVPGDPSRHRLGARAGAAPRLPRLAVVPDLPGAGPLPGLPGAAGSTVRVASRCPAGGAGRSSRRGCARTATGAGCGRPWWGRCAPPRSSGGPSPTWRS